MILDKIRITALLSLTLFLTSCGGSSANSYYKTGNKFMEKQQYEDALEAGV